MTFKVGGGQKGSGVSGRDLPQPWVVFRLVGRGCVCEVLEVTKDIDMYKDDSIEYPQDAVISAFIREEASISRSRRVI